MQPIRRRQFDAVQPDDLSVRSERAQDVQRLAPGEAVRLRRARRRHNRRVQPVNVDGEIATSLHTADELAVPVALVHLLGIPDARPTRLARVKATSSGQTERMPSCSTCSTAGSSSNRRAMQAWL